MAYQSQSLNCSMYMCDNIDVKTQFCLVYVIQEYRGEDVSDLYLEERDQQLKSAQEEKRKVQLSVPGIVNPHDVPEEMQD